MSKTHKSFKGLHIPVLSLVGVGPGDPSLMTLAAINAIKESTVVAYPTASQKNQSMALEIASKWISKDKRCLPIFFPMIHDEKTLRDAWREGGERISKNVIEGEKVVFLCEGDVSLYATSSYLFLYLNNHYPEIPIRMVPGISSISAAAASAQLPLALQQDRLLILPAPNDVAELENLLDQAKSTKMVLALLKLGHRWPWIKSVLEQRNLLEDSVFAQRLGWPDEKIEKAIEVSSSIKPYFSLLLVRQQWPKLLLSNN